MESKIAIVITLYIGGIIKQYYIDANEGDNTVVFGDEKYQVEDYHISMLLRIINLANTQKIKERKSINETIIIIEKVSNDDNKVEKIKINSRCSSFRILMDWLDRYVK